jgi:transmembrane sensor
MSVDQQPMSDELREQAAAWVVRLNSGPSEIDLDRFSQWRNQSPLHERAFDQAMTAWLAVGEHASEPRLLAMRRDVLERAGRAQNRWSRRAIAAAIALLILTPLLAFVAYQWQMPKEQGFKTAHGEQRVIVLDDGTRMSLDAVTEVVVKYTPDVRNIELLAGRANFEVAKDVTRPLKVKVGPRSVTALGTVFTVEREPSQVVVTLVEGLVAVSTGGQATDPIEMRPRQELRVMDGGEVALRDGIDPDQALAWREGKLIFDNEPLRTVVARMNNYIATPLVAEGPAAELRVSGVFRAGDTAAFLEAIKAYFPVTDERRSDAVTLRLAAPAQSVH